MTRTHQWLGCALIVIASLLTTACEEGGIGMGVPTSGARWGGGGSGPNVLVAGGPVYR
jgi:hypothetical protein